MKYLGALVGAILGVGLVYLFGSFANWSFNSGTWSGQDRGMLCFLAFLLMIPGAALGGVIGDEFS